jgi:exopolyphosphatase/guanosine-5'-triphosphate,3'-diphosphate pyrophosphatase
MDEVQSVNPQTIAIIDCGTNTFNLLVAEVAEGKWKSVFENKIGVKLGAGSFETGSISASRFIRGVDAMYCHANNAKNFGCNRLYGFATSAVRDSDNGVDFVRAVSKVAGVEIRVLNGDEEAEFICYGIRETIDLKDNISLMMDIGGGSTEFIIADHETIYWKQSLQLGVSRLHDIIKPSERLSKDEVQRLKSILDKQLVNLGEALKKYAPKWLIGSSGSFDTISGLYHHSNKSVEPEGSRINEIPLSFLPSIHSWLMSSSYEERLRHPVIPELRAEYMPLASYLIHNVLQLYSFEKMMHSTYALKEGVISKVVASME